MYRNIVTVVVSLLLIMALPALARTKYDVTKTHSLVGLQGYDPVAYFTQGKAVRGHGNIVARFHGVKYIFSSRAHKKLFAKEPSQYLPAYGGFCAYAVRYGRKVIADPRVWSISNGVLYFNLDARVQVLWLRKLDKHISEADRAWPKIAVN